MIRVDLTGDFRTEIYDLARRALANGGDPNETIETWRDGKPDMEGNVGALAKLTVSENARQGPRVVKYRPFPVRGSDRWRESLDPAGGDSHQDEERCPESLGASPKNVHND